MDKNHGLIERVKRLLDGRDKYPWGNDIGLGKGVIDGLTRIGAIPGGETLAIIHRCENVRIDWLLEGRGAPFSVSVCATDDAAEELLQDLLGSEGWSVTIITDGQRLAIVLTLPGCYQVKDGKDENEQQRYRRIDYQVIEVLAGAIGQGTMELLKREADQRDTGFVLTVPIVMRMIESGQCGTYRLLHAPDAILSTRQKVDSTHVIFSQFEKIEISPTTPEEASHLKTYRVLTPEDRIAVNQVMTSLADYKKGK